MKRKNKNTGRISSIATGTSGAASVISAHNVCHAICLGAVALLSVFGIAISSSALMFLQDYNLVFWSMGLFFLLVSAILYIRLGCISKQTMTANAGIIIAGVPFFPAEQLAFWLAGGSVFLIVAGRYIMRKAGVKA